MIGLSHTINTNYMKVCYCMLDNNLTITTDKVRICLFTHFPLNVILDFLQFYWLTVESSTTQKSNTLFFVLKKYSWARPFGLSHWTTKAPSAIRTRLTRLEIRWLYVRPSVSYFPGCDPKNNTQCLCWQRHDLNGLCTLQLFGQKLLSHLPIPYSIPHWH